MSTAGQETLNWSRDRRPRSRALPVSWFFVPLTRVKRVRTFIFFGERQLSDKLTVLYCEEVVVGIFIRFSCERKPTLGAFRRYGDVNLFFLAKEWNLLYFLFKSMAAWVGRGRLPSTAEQSLLVSAYLTNKKLNRAFPYL